MNFLNVEVKGLKELNQFINSLDKKNKKLMIQEFKETGKKLTYMMRRDVPVDQSRLKNSIYSDLTNNNGEIGVSISARSEYAPYMEFGTKKNFKAPEEIAGYAANFRGRTGISDVDPLVLLTAWVRRKGLAASYSTKRINKRTGKGVRLKRNSVEEQKEAKIAYAIFWKIKKVGVKAHPFFFSDKAGNSRFEQYRTILINNITKGIKSLLGD